MNDSVSIPIDLTINSIKSAVNSADFEKSLNKSLGVKKTPLALRKLGAMIGKDTTSDLRKAVSAEKRAIDELIKERNRLKDALGATTTDKSAMISRANSRVKRSQEENKRLTELQKTLTPEEYKKQVRLYASAKGAVANAKNPVSKAAAEMALQSATARYKEFKSNYSPEGRKWISDRIADNNKIIASGGFNSDEVAKFNDRVRSLSESFKLVDKQIRSTQAVQNKQNADLSSIIASEPYTDPDKNTSKKKPKKSGGRGNNTFKNLGKNLMKFGLGFRSLYYLVRAFKQMVTEGLGTLASQFTEINKPLSDLLTSFNKLKGSIVTAVQPIISAIVPALKVLIDYLAEAATKVGEFFATMTGQKYIYKAKANQKDFAAAINGTEKVAKYDKLEVIKNGNDVNYEKQAISMVAGAEKLQEIFATMQELFGTIFGIIKDIFSQTVGGITSALPLINGVLKVINAVLSVLWPIFDIIIDMTNSTLTELNTALEPLLIVIAEELMPFLGELISAFLPVIQGFLDIIVAVLKPIFTALGPALSLVISLLQPILSVLSPILEVVGSLLSTIAQIIEPVSMLLTPLVELLNSILKPTMSALSILINVLLKPIVSIFKTIIGLVSLLVKGLNLVLTKLTELIAKLKNGVTNNINGFLNNILSGIEFFINKIIMGVNKLIDALNTISFGIPEWVPLIGGKTFGINIPRVSEISIPRLAQGAVIPPNSEFLALMGDQKSGTNIEAPLDTIKQALAEVLNDAGGNKSPIVLQLDGKTVAKVVWEQSEKKYKQTGKLSYAY